MTCNSVPLSVNGLNPAREVTKSFAEASSSYSVAPMAGSHIATKDVAVMSVDVTPSAIGSLGIVT